MFGILYQEICRKDMALLSLKTSNMKEKNEKQRMWQTPEGAWVGKVGTLPWVILCKPYAVLLNNATQKLSKLRL